MKQTTAEHLLEINRDFYNQFATQFAATRENPQPGFHDLLPYLSKSKSSVLDVGCGEGRFGRFLSSKAALGSYTGIDFTDDLVQMARRNVDGKFLIRDFWKKNWTDELVHYDVVACLAALQHSPLASRRIEILAEMGELLNPDGVILLSCWQFVESERQRRKIASWTEVGLTSQDVEINDYLLTWGEGGQGLRYVCYIDINMLHEMASQAGLRVVHSFRNDGKESNLNLYAVLSLN